MSERIALPDAFASLSLCALEPAQHGALLSALEEEDHIRALRMRPGKEPPPEARERVPWAKNAWYIDISSKAGSHVLHAAGAYYLQEASAMSAVAALDVQPGMRVLDVCAAPGGKSTQIAGLLEGKGLLVSNEIVPSRAKILSQNLERMGVQNALVTNESPEKLARKLGETPFDRVLVDAPCSGEGMFRREKESRKEWSEQGVQGCAERQRLILDSAAQLVAPGGLMVYSTCTFNTLENEENVALFLKNHPEFEAENFALEGVGESENGCLHLWPHRLRGEGHFVSRLRRKGEREPAAEFPETSPRLPSFFAECIPGFRPRGTLFQAGDRLWLLPAGAPETAGLKVLRFGLALGEQRGRNFLPDHALAVALDKDCFKESVEVGGEEACAFLQGQVLSAPESLKGWVQVCYGGCGLGWAKASDGMLKNHLPKGLRKNYISV